MPLRRQAALAALLLTVGGAPRLAPAEVDRNYWRSATMGVEIAFPTEWAVAEQGSFPSLLATAVDRALGGRMTLSLERLRPGERVRDCAERNRVALGKAGFKVGNTSLHPTGAVLFEATTSDGRRMVRQAYRIFEGDERVFVLTLAGPRETMQRYRRAFDDALRGLTLTRKPSAPRPAATDPLAPTGGAPDAREAPDPDAGDPDEPGGRDGDTGGAEPRP